MYYQYGSLLPQTLKELVEYVVRYIVITYLGTFWKNSQWVAQAHNGYIVIKIVKETRGFFQKVATGYFCVFFVKVISMYPLFTLWSKWWIHFKKTQHISAGFWLGKLLKKSQLNHNVSTDYIPPCPQCEFIVTKPTMNSHYTHWVNAPLPPVHACSPDSLWFGQWPRSPQWRWWHTSLCRTLTHTQLLNKSSCGC